MEPGPVGVIRSRERAKKERKIFLGEKKGKMRLSSRRAIFDVLFRFSTVTRLHSP